MEVQSNVVSEVNGLSKDEELPQCKIKRNYSCIHCSYFTQNPRFHLTHLRDVHGERIVINKCNFCLYASRHYQKLVRHMKMVHGSTEGITGQSRKRVAAEDAPRSLQIKEKELTPPPAFIFPEEPPINIDNLFNDLELSRNSLKDFAALYFAENHIDNIMMQMEEADSAQMPPPFADSIPTKRKTLGNTFFDKLKESFVGEDSLICGCGHESKCFSESVIHQRSCEQIDFGEKNSTTTQIPLNGGSTRCQNCRRRCKSSADLLNHMAFCTISSDMSMSPKKQMFIWNQQSNPTENLKQDYNEKLGIEFKRSMPSSPHGDNEVTNCYLGLETATGYGEVTKKIAPNDAPFSLFRKVFKCPRCSFWASTASRFHVHIVGHLNQKPFKCSLCAYRSNWRWDITKHIRLRTIRNLNHKNARVLMSDETGRRNYSQYNKYIARLKITDVKDSKVAQSDTLSVQPGKNKESLSSGSIHCELKHKKPAMQQIPNKKKYLLPSSVKSIMPRLRNSSDEISEGEKTSYHCHKCDFKHVSRDAVLAHVKIHSSTIHQSIPLDLVKSPDNQHNGNRNETGTNRYEDNVSDRSAAGEVSEEFISLTGNAPNAADSPLSSVREHSPFNDGVKSSSVLIGLTSSTSFDNASNEKRGPSPFRCGHCHQVSNWKHVIQRHCRLKHSGHIRIEAYDRSSDKRTPLYRQITFLGGEEVRAFENERPTKQPALNLKNNIKHAGTRLHNVELETPKSTSPATKEQEIIPLNKPFSNSSARDNKSQLLYHITMQHATNSNRFPKTVEHIIRSGSKKRSPQSEKKPLSNITDPKLISYCPKCPERFVSGSKKLCDHLKLHGANLDMNCDVCDFSTIQRTNMLSHAFVHTNEYQEKTKHFAKTGREDPLYPAPKLVQIKASQTNEIAWVVEETEKQIKDYTTKQKPPSTSISQVPNETSEKCPYCPFETTCQVLYKDHLQHHTRISHSSENFTCEHCDFTSDSEDTCTNHMRVHFKTLESPKSTSFCTSHDKLELVVTDNNQKKNGKAKAPSKTIKFKGKQECGKKEITLNLRCKRSTGQNVERKSTVCSPPATLKTILVNPKTGQVIRRN